MIPWIIFAVVVVPLVVFAFVVARRNARAGERELPWVPDLLVESQGSCDPGRDNRQRCERSTHSAHLC